GVVDALPGLQRPLRHDRRVPIAGPPLVHDLRLALRSEIIRLIADNLDDVALPRLYGSVLDQEQEHVLLRVLGEIPRSLLLLLLLLFLLGLQLFLWVNVVIHVVLT